MASFALKYGWYRLARLLLLAALTCALPGAGLAQDPAASGDGSAAAEPELTLGAQSISFTPGYGVHSGGEYSGYALPVANSGLARDWARRGGMQWQAAYNYSVLPLRVDIVHRGPSAFQGRLEVESEFPYASGEGGVNDRAVISREVLVPPSVPQSFYFAPRVCPPSQPGGLVSVKLRLYAGGNSRPQLEAQMDAIQLAPAHVYSLLLDPPGPAIPGDAINAGNHLQLHLRQEPDAGLVYDGFSVTRFDNYLLPCERSMLCGLPLAARDFAFVCADLSAVRNWPAAQQEALAAFMLGGGYLCAYNCGHENWQGLNPWPAGEDGPLTQAVGRGMLLPVAGPLAQARLAMQQYLEGELEEWVLWTGGSVRGQSLPLPAAQTVGRSAGLRDIYKGRELPSQQPGYLHPIWAYRELCRGAMLEPWDFPEFNYALTPLNQQDSRSLNPIVLANSNWGSLHNEEGALLPPPLAQQLRPLATVPRALAAALLLALLGLWPGRRRRPALRTAALLAAVAGCCAVFYSSHPAVAEPLRLELADSDARLAPQALRTLCARAMRGSGRIDVELPSDALVRQVRGIRPGSWTLDAAKDGGFAVDCDGFASVSVDSWRPGASALALSPRSRRIDAAHTEIRLDTRPLPAGSGAWVITPYGANYVPAGIEDWRLELRMPRLPARPGLARLNAWVDWLSDASGRRDLISTLASSPWDLQLRSLTLFPESCGVHDPLRQLAWGGLLQMPLGMRGALGMQGVLLYEQPQSDSPAPGVKHLQFARLSFPLEGQP